MGLKARLNITYAAVQAVFWVVCCPVVGFGSAYLLACGFSSTHIGVMLGVANILALAVQPVLSARADANRAFTPLRIVMGLTLAVALSSAVQLATMPRGMVMALLWTFSATCAIAANVFVTAVKFQIDEDDSIDFGTCRAVGSLAWGTLSAGLGFAVERFGMRLIPAIVLAAGICFIALLLYCERLDRVHEGMQASELDAEDEGDASTWAEFLRTNKWLVVLLVGIALVYMHHALANYFSMVLVQNVGGDSSDMGLIVALAAVLEIPGMVAFSRLERRFGTKPILMFSLAMFALKAVALWQAASVMQLTAAFSIQLLCYGLFTTSTVSFADKVVRSCDLVKAQACFTLVTTASGIFSSFAGGALIDYLGVKSTLSMMGAGALLGLGIAAMSLARIRLREDDAA